MSTLAPYSSLPVHTGESGLNLICHFGIDVPVNGDMGMVVATDSRRWREGNAILFNDSYPHTAYNHSPYERTVLLIEHWNPSVRHDARALLAEFVRLWSEIAPRDVFLLNNIDSYFECATNQLVPDVQRSRRPQVRPVSSAGAASNHLPWEQFMD